MGKEPMLSVLVTFYNQRKYIKDSLSSILGQKVDFNYEVICCDDGSLDGTYEELLEWERRYPDILHVFQMRRDGSKRYEPITRVSRNRLNMLKKSRGKYLIFLDGDDYFTDLDKFQLQVNLMERYPECAGCGHPMWKKWEDHSKKDEMFSFIGKDPVIIKNKIYWAYIWFHADSFVYRNYYKGKEDEINGDFFDDNLITCYFVKYGDVIYVPKCMGVYRQVPGSSWNMRNDLEKAFVNMHVWSESIKVLPDMKIRCFIKSYSAWRQFYINRHKKIDLENDRDFISNARIVCDTIAYRSASIYYKAVYEIKYFIPMHIGLGIKILNKLKRFTFKRIII